MGKDEGIALIGLELENETELVKAVGADMPSMIDDFMHNCGYNEKEASEAAGAVIDYEDGGCV